MMFTPKILLLALTLQVNVLGVEQALTGVQISQAMMTWNRWLKGLCFSMKAEC
jgi:hypothetical protein